MLSIVCAAGLDVRNGWGFKFEGMKRLSDAEEGWGLHFIFD